MAKRFQLTTTLLLLVSHIIFITTQKYIPTLQSLILSDSWAMTLFQEMLLEHLVVALVLVLGKISQSRNSESFFSSRSETTISNVRISNRKRVLGYNTHRWIQYLEISFFKSWGWRQSQEGG